MAVLHQINARKPLRINRVGIYARVSSTRKAQLNSIANQVSELTRFVHNKAGWTLVDIYIDFESGTGSKYRPQFERMITDAKIGVIDVVLTKSIQRFGRNTVENLETMRELIRSGAVIYFHLEGISSNQPDAELQVSLFSGLAEADNESHRADRMWGMQKRIEDGTSELYRRPCYGYEKNDDGVLTINWEQARVVKDIFAAYLEGRSISGIQRMLEERKIPSPKGGPKWPARTIDMLLSNEKYTGEIILFKTVTLDYPYGVRLDNRNGDHHARYAISNGVDAIIGKETFDQVQEEKKRRSPYEEGPDGKQRKRTRYSSKTTGK